MEDEKKPETPAEEEVKKYARGANNYMKYMGAGVQLISPVIIGALVGYWIDSSQHNAKPIWTIILSSVMIMVGLYLFIKRFLKG